MAAIGVAYGVARSLRKMSVSLVIICLRSLQFLDPGSPLFRSTPVSGISCWQMVVIGDGDSMVTEVNNACIMSLQKWGVAGDCGLCKVEGDAA